jgi:ankyrin repeat protein
VNQKVRPLYFFFLLLSMNLLASTAQTPSANLVAAIRNNDLTALRSLANSGNVDTPDDRRRTPLMIAAGTGTLDAMQILLTAGADVNAGDPSGVTPLMYGARDIAKVRLLIEKGARVNDKSRQGQNALLIAASTSGSIETVRLLVSKGADAKVVGAGGRTGLIAAAGANDLEMVRFFVDQGVNVNAVNQVDLSGHTALMAAAAQNNTAAVKLLLEKGADVNLAATGAAGVKNGTLAYTGRTALMMAAAYGSPELIGLLLKARANVNARDVAGLTPLMFAVASENQDPEVVKLLISAGADVEAKSTTNETARDWARKYGSPDVLKLLHSEPAAPTRVQIPNAIPSPSELRSQIGVSAALLQRVSTEASSAGGCTSCHHQYFTAAAIVSVREKGVSIDGPAAARLRETIIQNIRGRESSFVQRTECCGSLETTLYSLAALQADKYPADGMTDAVLAHLLSRQFADGRWPREETSRAPLQDGDVNRAVNAMSLLQAYAPPAMKAEADVHIRRTAQWLLKAPAVSTDDKAMLLVGLKKSGAPQPRLEAAAKVLLVAQHADGGWGGNANLESDAYATSEALLALLDSGILTPADPVYQRGVRFLIATRATDGSWHVRSRAPKFQPYFESGFPYGHDQWISAAATARAITSIARVLQ